MQMKTLVILTCASLALTGCGRGGGSSPSSSLNPFKWFGGGGQNQQTTLAPEGGYPAVHADDNMPSLAHVAAARWQPLYEGRMLIVEGSPATQGWWNVKLVTELPMPAGRIRGDESGVLRLRLVGMPPPAETFAASAPAQQADRVTVGLTLPHEAMATIREVVITSATNSVTLRR